MASRKCWFCGFWSHFTLHGQPFTYLLPDESLTIVSGAFLCDHCQTMSIGVLRRTGTSSHIEDLKREFAVSLDVQWIPASAAGKSFPDVPAHIASAADEAYRCASIEAYRGAVILARSVIEATAKVKGISGRTLKEKIDAMVTVDLLRPRIGAAAPTLRVCDDMAHGDFEEVVDAELSQLLLLLMDEVLMEVFQSPAMHERTQAALAEKRQPTNP